MNKKLLFLSLIFITPHIHGMFTKQDKRQSTRAHKKHYNGARKHACVQKFISRHHKRPKFHSIISTDLAKQILNCIITTSESLPVAARTVSHLVQTSKTWKKLINHNCLNLIKQCSQTFDYSNEEVAKILPIRAAWNRYCLQSTFATECKRHDKKTPLILDKFKKNGADLDFTYEDNCCTALMMTLSSLSPTGIQWLINNGANINMISKNGAYTFQYACNCPFAIPSLLNHPEFNSNQRDKNGNTPLMFLLNNLKLWPNALGNKRETYTAMEQLLEKGADPKLANNERLTALAYVQQKAESYPEFVTLIEDAIAKKHAQKQ